MSAYTITAGAALAINESDVTAVFPQAALSFTAVQVSVDGTNWTATTFRYLDTQDRYTSTAAASTRAFVVETRGANLIRFQGVSGSVTANIPAPLGSSGVDAVPVTPNDSTDLPSGPCRALYIGVPGNLRITTATGTVRDIPNVGVGFFDVKARRVHATGTAADSITAIY